MLANISTISLATLYQNEESFDNFYDVFLVNTDKDYHDTQAFLEQNNTLVFITLEEADLVNKQVLVKAIYEAVMDEPADSDNVRENIEAIEEALNEVNCCVLGFPGFYNCDAETQAELLELPIVSESFKLLLCIDESAFSENLSLWKVLLSRSLVIDAGKNPEYVSVDSFSVYEVENEEADEADFDSGNDETIEKAWYQMIPKYHLATALVLVFVIFALWKMDLTTTKEESIALKVSVPTAVENMETEQQSPQIMQNDKLQNGAEQKQIKPESKVDADDNTLGQTAVNRDRNIETIAKETTEADQAPREVVDKKTDEPEVVEVDVKEKPDTELLREKEKSDFRVDWSPYQSYQWIEGLNKEYFTLQLMASHSEKGVRDFLLERGVSSQYAVYTVEKDGKPWHVIIYGVYQTRDFADDARQDLPSYLKAHSPWIRPLADIQAALP